MNKQDCGFIYTQYRDKVFGNVRSKAFRSEDVEDLVQEVFLKVYANLDKYDEVKASLSTWIYTITRNTVYDYLKAKRDRPVFELLDNTEDATDEAPDEELLRNETLEELACALEKLPQEQRDIIILLYYKNLERKYVAEMLGMTYGQLRYLHDKALRRLGELLRIK